MARHAELFALLSCQALVIRCVRAVATQAPALLYGIMLVLPCKAPFVGMTPKAQFLTLCHQQLRIFRHMGPVALQALSVLKRPVAEFSCRKPFVAFMTALAQLADLLLYQIFILCGMGIVTTGTLKLPERLVCPLLSHLLLDTWMTLKAFFEAPPMLASPSVARDYQEQQQYEQKNMDEVEPH